MTVIFPVVTRFADVALRAYDLSPAPVTGPLTPAAVFPIEDGVVPQGYDTAPDLGMAAWTTADEAVCVDPRGEVRWRLDFGPRGGGPIGGRVSCHFSLDGRVLWIYRPDSEFIRASGFDRWLAVDTSTGAVLAETELPAAGHGATQLPHPDGDHMLIDVGEGQDGCLIFRGRLAGDTIALTPYPWDDRSLVGIAPDGRHFMTVHHGQEDVAFHTWPDGTEVLRLPVAAFGHDEDESYVEWGGGYLDSDTAVVVLAGEDEDGQAWYRHQLVDVRTGALLGPLETPSRDEYDVEPHGDGSWWHTDEQGRPCRHVRST